MEIQQPMIQIAVTHAIGSLYCTPVPVYKDGKRDYGLLCVLKAGSS